MLKNCIKNWKRIDDDMAADVAQCERSKIKCYASAFSNILISKPRKKALHYPYRKTSTIRHSLSLRDWSVRPKW